MLKARARTKDGRTLFVFGLSAQNRELLLVADNPIYFAGSEEGVGQPDGHFLICHAESQAALVRVHNQYAANDPRFLYSVGLDSSVLGNLHREAVRVPGLRRGSADVLVFAGETERQMGVMLGYVVPALEAGMRGVYDPITGRIELRPTDKPS